MANHKTKLELTWIGKENRPRLEPRILMEDPGKRYHTPHRVGDNDRFDNLLPQASRSRDCCELSDAQDAIDVQRDELIGKVERQMRQRTNVLPIHSIRWGIR